VLSDFLRHLGVHSERIKKALDELRLAGYTSIADLAAPRGDFEKYGLI